MLSVGTPFQMIIRSSLYLRSDTQLRSYASPAPCWSMNLRFCAVRVLLDYRFRTALIPSHQSIRPQAIGTFSLWRKAPYHVAEPGHQFAPTVQGERHLKQW